MTITIPTMSPFPGRGAAPEDYIAQADTTMQQLPGVIAKMNEMGAAFNLGSGVLAGGYLPPVPYAAGLSITLALQTVQRGETTYAPLLERLPFVTGAEFDATAWRVVQGLIASALAAPTGLELAGYVAPGAHATPRTARARLGDFVSILDYDAFGDGASDDQPAFQRARYDSDRIYFPLIGGIPTTYRLASAAVEMVYGTILRADPGVTISWPTGNNYHLFDNVTFDSDICFEFRDSQTRQFYAAKTPSRHKLDHLALPGPALRRNRIALDCASVAQVNLRRVNWPTGDVFSAADGTTAYDSVTMAATNVGRFAGAFVGLGVYETISAYFDGGQAVGVLGIMVRGTNGYAVLYGASSTADLTIATKLTGQAVTEKALPWGDLGQGRYTSFAPGNSVWSVSKTDADRVVVKLNGKAVTTPFLSGVGAIFEVGFVSYGAVAHRISGFTVERRTDAIVGMPKINVLIHGDSTAATFVSSWDKLIRPLMDTVYGVAVGTITNRATSGDNIQQQYVSLTQNGIGNAYYVGLCIATNDVQGLTDLTQFEATARALMAQIISLGGRPVVMPPWMWYGWAQSGGAGQNAANYDRAGPYCMALERIGYELGAVVIKLREELPNPDPLLLTTDPSAKLVRDCIHQDLKADQLYARAFNSGVIDDYMSLPDSVVEPVAALMLNGATAASDLRICYGKDGLASLIGTMGVAGIANEGEVMTVPRYIVPVVGANPPVIALNAALDPIGSCWINIDPTTGKATLQRPPAGTTTIILGGGAWKTAASAA